MLALRTSFLKTVSFVFWACVGGTFLLCALLPVFPLSQLAIAETNTAQSQEERLSSAFVDKVALALTGKLASTADLNAIIEGSKGTDAFLEDLKKDPAFEEKLVAFWLGILKIQGFFDTATVEGPSAGGATEKLATQADRAEFTFAKSRIIDITRISDKAVYNEIRGIKACESPRVTRTFARAVIYSDERLESLKSECENQPGAAKRNACIKRWDDYKNITRPVQLANLDAVECACGSEVNVTAPWWNPNITVKACPEAVATCGQKLEACSLFDTRLDARLRSQHANNYAEGNDYVTHLIEALTTEPGRIVAKNIVLERNFQEVLTTQSTFLNGAAEHFLANDGSLLVRNAPAGSYKTSSGVSTLVANQPARSSYREVARGPGHAGILTTPMFHQVTNGYRAKANRIYEGFLCKRFVIGSDTVNSPSNVTDLTQREPCAQCHRTLEPLGRYFYKWEQVGLNYLYTPTENAAGRFGNSSGSDTIGFGNAISQNEAFARCAVQRAFEFTMGRELTLSNSDQILSGVPEYTAALGAALEEAAADKSVPSKVKTKTYEAWVELCVALATDPRVFMR